MPSPAFPPLVEVFLLVEQPRQRLSHWTQALAPLDGVSAPPVASVEAHYDPSANQAMFGLRYDELALGPTRLSFLVEVALLAEIGMIQPAELTEADRERFITDRLASCTLHVGDHRRVVDALVELVRIIRSSRPRPAASFPAMEVGEPNLSRPAAVMVPPVNLPNAPLEPMQVVARGTRDLSPSELRGAHALARGSAQRPSQPSPNVIVRSDVHRASTVVRSSTETDRLLDAEPLVEVDVPTVPYLPAVGNVPEPDMIYARYLRSERWVPSRISTLSLKGAALMAGALPRIDDRIDITLAYANYRALVRGAVEKISTDQEAATSGTTTFSVSFELDVESRRELTALLTAARAAKVTLKPPPLRRTRRYAVEWPIYLGTPRGRVRARALDVSVDGMFVSLLRQVTLDGDVTFSMVIDDGLTPVAGRSRVVRNLGDDEARAAGRPPGYGLSILEMSEHDRERWSAFLLRIERRSERRVLIGATPARLAELRSGLEAAGYAVTGSSEPSAMAQLVSAQAHPVDAALIDAGWLAATPSARVESLFSARKVPCVTLHGDTKRARTAVDQLLDVV